MKRYTLTIQKEYKVDLLPTDIFENLERKFLSRTRGVYTFRPYRVDIIGTERILSTKAKEVQEFIEQIMVA